MYFKFILKKMSCGPKTKDIRHLNQNSMAALPRYAEAVLDEMWRRLPGKSPLRQAAAVLACGTHHRLGRVSPLRSFNQTTL